MIIGTRYRYNTMTKHIYTFDLTKELYEKLRKLAFKRRVSIAKIVREAIEQYLARKENA